MRDAGLCRGVDFCPGLQKKQCEGGLGIQNMLELVFDKITMELGGWRSSTDEWMLLGMCYY